MEEQDLLALFPGENHLKTRRLYNSLKEHYEYARCHYCTFYKQYGVMIVNGDFTEHIRRLNGERAMEISFLKLEGAGLIERERITPHQHRITIAEFQPQEALA